MKTIRTFFVNERNEIKRIPINFFNAWNNGEIALPEYRNQNVRLAVFIGEAQGKAFRSSRGILRFFANRCEWKDTPIQPSPQKGKNAPTLANFL